MIAVSVQGVDEDRQDRRGHERGQHVADRHRLHVQQAQADEILAFLREGMHLQAGQGLDAIECGPRGLLRQLLRRELPR